MELARCEFGDTSIDRAARFNTANWAALNLYFQLRASPNITDPSCTSLHSLSLYSNADSLHVIELLLARRASTDNVDLLELFCFEDTDLVYLEKTLILLLLHD